MGFTRKLLLGVSALMLFALVACGSPPTEQAAPAPGSGAEAGQDGGTETGGTDAGEAAPAGNGDPSTFEEIYAEIEGLDDEARRERLIEMAQEAGGTVNVYSTMNGPEGPQSMELFEELTGIRAEFYRASATDVLNRVLQEHEAGYNNQADVITSNGTEMVILEREGLLAPVNTIAADDLPEGGVTDYYGWTYLNVFTPLWNTNSITPDRAPTTWTDVLQNYPGELVAEAGDWDWFAAVVPIVMEEQGISEEEAIAMVGEAIRTAAAMVSGHTTMAQFVAAGQYDIAASAYHSTGVDLKEEGAPVEWEPPVEPLIVRPNAAGINVEAPNPAGAVLFLDFFLTEAQAVMAEHGRQPANLATEGGSLPPDYEFVVVDLEELVDERDEWESTYDDFVRQSGLPVQE